MAKAKFIHIKSIGVLSPRTSAKGNQYMAADIVYQLEGSIGKQSFREFIPELWEVGQLGIQEPKADGVSYHEHRSPAEIADGKVVFADAKVTYKDHLVELGL